MSTNTFDKKVSFNPLCAYLAENLLESSCKRFSVMVSPRGDSGKFLGSVEGAFHVAKGKGHPWTV